MARLIIELTAAFPITWIRLVINTADSWDTSQVSLQFSNSSGSGTVSCTNQRKYIPTNQTLDIYCDLQETVEQVIIEGSGIKSLCSVYVSGGRNVALKQSTTQSSTLDSRNSSYAVDGNTNMNYYTCTHTDHMIHQQPYWTVTFTSPVQINRYVLYNRQDGDGCCPARLGGFTLTSFYAGNEEIFNHTDQNKAVQDVYTVTSTTQTSPIDTVTIRTVYTDQIIDNPVVTLCEAEMYGDSFCTTPHYGRNCENPCNCYNNEKCFVSTGGCPNGCAEGFYGEACAQETAQQTDSEELPPVAAIVVPIVAALVIAVLIALGVVLWWGRRQRKESNTYTTPTQNNSRNKSCQDFSQSNAYVLAGLEASKKTTNEEKELRKKSSSPSENVVDDEDTQSMATIESMPTKTVDEMKKPEPPLKPKPTGTRHNTEKLKNQEGGPYYNSFAGLSETAIDIEKLDVFIDSHKKEFFQSQFNKIPASTKATMAIAQSPEHRLKNRYKNICAYDHSRVHLTENKAKKHGGYINASYVEGYKSEERFIASQGPTQAILEDFVRMLWEQDIERVVMLTNVIEGGTMKSERYWPEDSDINIGEITVRLTTSQVFADYTIRRLQLMKLNESPKNLTQFHFTTWPDKDVPTIPWGLVDFEQRVATYSSSKPIVVHCSAGVGRTGTFIALRNVIKEAEDTGYMDFFTTVQKLRADRMNMVQTAEQYEFLHKAALIAMVCRRTTVTSSNIADRIKELENVLKKKGPTKMEKEFKAICNVCEDKDDADQTESTDDNLSMYQNSQALANKHKNQLSNILPKDYFRVILSRENEELEDYINAVFVPSLVKHDQQILTQLPLPTTVTDFWRMVTQYQVKLIVAFDTDPNQKDSTLGKYLPAQNNPNDEFLHLNVGPVSCGNFWEERHVLISIDDEIKATMSTYKNLDDGHRVTHLKCTKEDLTSSELLALAKEIRAKRPVGDCRVVYMCRNGADYSGLICVLLLLLDRIDNDHCLTVPLVVGAIKAIRPQVIPTMAQYKTLYQVLKLYNEMNNEYCNFGEVSTKKT